LINLSIDDLLKKAKMDNKYELVCLIIKRIRRLIKEKEKMGLLSSNEKLTSIALKEIENGKLKIENFVEEK
jgi:DNA-directed RNA polymerase omega subunit